MSNLRSSKTHSSKLIVLSIIITSIMAFSSALFTSTLLANTDSESALALTTDKNHLKVYLKPGVSLSSYKALQVSPVTVAFKNNWLKNYNRSHKALAERINEKEANVIKGRVQKQFQISFPEYLASEGHHSITTESNETTLMLKPMITDLVINAPDLTNAMRKDQYVRQVGSATLTVELYDAASGQLVGKLVSEEETYDNSRLMKTNRVINNSEFRRVYRLWAKDLIAIL